MSSHAPTTSTARGDGHGIRVGIRCDALPGTGVGHALRCLALADELLARGVQVELYGDLQVELAASQAAARGLQLHPAPADPVAFVALARQHRLDAVVLDGYLLPAALGAGLRAAGITVLALIDFAFGAHQDADVYVDQNLGATRLPDLPADRVVLAGLDYALFRDDVLSRRVQDGRPRGERRPLRVLGVFGGTDPFGASPVLARMVLETRLPVHLTVVAARPDLAERLRALPLGAGQDLDVVPPTPDLAALTVTCDVAVTAAGTSVWELLCLGMPTALVAVVDNQEVGFVETTRRGLAVPVGRLAELEPGSTAYRRGVEALDRLLRDPAQRRLLRETGAATVDGQGRARVVDALFTQVHGHRP